MPARTHSHFGNDGQSSTVVHTIDDDFADDRVCPGCKQSVVNDNGGVVVAFGTSLFHVDCFRCAKCENRVTADTNLLLLSDGSPVCASCSYNCNICHLPILDEAIMTGDDSYHANCFKCKVCKQRIDELVFAKTSQGIYCMNCHNERVARSRRHAERQRIKEKEKAAAAVGASQQTQEQRINGNTPSPALNTSTFSTIPSSSAMRSAPSPARLDHTRTNGSTSRPHTSDSTIQPPTPMSGGRRRSLQSNGLTSPKNSTGHNKVSTRSVVSAPDPNRRDSTMRRGSDGSITQPLQVLYKPPGEQDSSDSPPNSANYLAMSENHSLDVPGTGTVRADQPRSMNPGQGLSNYDHDPANQSGARNSSPTSPTSPAIPRAQASPTYGRDASHGPSPLREFFPSTPTTRDMSINGSRSQSPHVDSRSESPAHKNVGSDSPAHRGASPALDHGVGSPTEDRLQQSPRPSVKDISLDKVPPRFQSLRHNTIDDKHESSQLNNHLTPGTGHTLRPQRSFDDRARKRSSLVVDDADKTSSSELGVDNHGLRRSRSVSGSRPGSPHNVDVSIEDDSGYSSVDRKKDGPPPAPPPKEAAGNEPWTSADAWDENPTRDLTIEEAPREDESPSPISTPSSPVERTSRMTFIAPALLPPIRISMVGSDFSDLLNSVGSTREGAIDVTPTPPPSAVFADDRAPFNAASPSTIKDVSRVFDSPPSLSQPGISHSPTSSSLSTSNSRKSHEREPPGLGYQDDSLRSPSSPRASVDSQHGSDSPWFNGTDANGRDKLDSLASIRDDSSNFSGTSVTLTTPGSVSKPISLRQGKDLFELVSRRLREALRDAQERGAGHVRFDKEFLEAILTTMDHRKDEFSEMKSRLDGMNRASQQFIEGMTVAQEEYNRELAARRNAEAEVTRLKVQLSGQAVQLSAMTGDERRRQLQEQMSRELSSNLSDLERNLSALKVQRDMTLAEVEELAASKSSSNVTSAPEDVPTGKLSRSLTMRLDNIRNQYQHELVPLSQKREALLREIVELKETRETFLEETAVLNARNEELAQLNAQYIRRLETATPELSLAQTQELRRTVTHSISFDQQRQEVPSSFTASTAASSTLLGDSIDSKNARVQKFDHSDAPAPPVKPAKFKWPGYKTPVKEHAPPSPASVTNSLPDLQRPKGRIEHSFQQLSVLRFARCDHCGEKMWGTQLRCTSCNLAVHTRCGNNVNLACSQQHINRDEALGVLPPSMFGRDLTEQVRADANGTDRTVPVIVEKCIHAVETLAMDYEGIYRKTGGAGQSKTITQLFERGRYDAFDLCDMNSFNDICSVTSVLKSYFRMLPDPLFTYALHESFVASAGIRDPATKSAALLETVNKLPKEHYYTLRFLMLHLHRVNEHNSHNLMNARNLGVVFGPTLLRSRDPAAEFSDMAGKAMAVEWLVEHAPLVFGQSGSTT